MNSSGQVKIRAVFIYTLADPFTGFVRYVGKTENLAGRYKAHLADKSFCHRAHWIRKVLSKGSSPVMDVVETLVSPNEQEWQEAEKFWISTLSFLGCDLTNGDVGGTAGNSKSAGTRLKISVALKGKKFSEDRRMRLSNAHKGYKPKPESVAKARAANTGRTRSQQAISNMKAAWEKRKLSGWKHSVESRLKISIGHRGKRSPMSEETKKKIGDSNRGKVHSKEQNKFHSDALKGRKQSPEHAAASARGRTGIKRSEAFRAKMRVIALARHEAGINDGFVKGVVE